MNEQSDQKPTFSRSILIGGVAAVALFACLVCTGGGIAFVSYGLGKKDAGGGVLKIDDAAAKAAAERMRLQNDAKEAALKAMTAAEAAGDPVAIRAAQAQIDAAWADNWQPRK